jgi:hypothetical protein
MLSKQEIPAPTAGVYTNGQAPAGKTVKTVTGQADSVKQRRRALRKLLRDLVAFTGTAINDLAATPRKAPQPKRQRLLYRRADSLNDADPDALVGEIGIGRWWAAAERATQPKLPLVAAE